MKNTIMLEGVIGHLNYTYEYTSSGGDERIEERMLFVLKFNEMANYRVDCIISGKKAKKYLGKLKTGLNVVVQGALAIGEKERSYIIIDKVTIL